MIYAIKYFSWARWNAPQAQDGRFTEKPNYGESSGCLQEIERLSIVADHTRRINVQL